MDSKLLLEDSQTFGATICELLRRAVTIEKALCKEVQVLVHKKGLSAQKLSMRCVAVLSITCKGE